MLLGKTRMGPFGDRARVLVVDDAPENRRLLKAMLTVVGYDVATADDGEEALARVQQEAPDLVLADAVMPRLSGYELCARLKASEDTRLIPVVLLTEAGEQGGRIRAIEAGSDDFVERPVNRAELLARVAALVRSRRLNEELVSLENAITALAIAIEAKDPYTEGHIERVSHYAVELGKRVSLSERERELLRKGAILHDVGKIGVGEAVLLKPGPLTGEEREHLKIHPVVGERICQPLRARLILDAVRHHHERYDGAGYPDGLVAEEIPLAARIMALADTWDALTTDRPYRGRLPLAKAAAIIRGEAGKQFDPKLVALFLGVVEGDPGREARLE